MNTKQQFNESLKQYKDLIDNWKGYRTDWEELSRLFRILCTSDIESPYIMIEKEIYNVLILIYYSLLTICSNTVITKIEHMLRSFYIIEDQIVKVKLVLYKFNNGNGNLEDLWDIINLLIIENNCFMRERLLIDFDENIDIDNQIIKFYSLREDKK